MYLAVALVILVLAGFGSAAPLCDSQTFSPCIPPIVTYIMSPENAQLGQMLQSGNITETHLVSLCRQVRTTLQCFTGAAERCIPSDLAELREYMTGANRLMTVCDRPDLHNRTSLTLQCDKTLNETRGSKSLDCEKIAVNEALAGVRGLLGSRRNDTIEQWRTGGVMKKLCCDMQHYTTCAGTEVADKCGAEAQQITDDIHHAIMGAFNCNGARVANCPVRASPTEEDANDDLDVTFNQLLKSLGGMGGPSTGAKLPT